MALDEIDDSGHSFLKPHHCSHAADLLPFMNMQHIHKCFRHASGQYEIYEQAKTLCGLENGTVCKHEEIYCDV